MSLNGLSSSKDRPVSASTYSRSSTAIFVTGTAILTPFCLCRWILPSRRPMNSASTLNVPDRSVHVRTRSCLGLVFVASLARLSSLFASPRRLLARSGRSRPRPSLGALGLSLLAASRARRCSSSLFCSTVLRADSRPEIVSRSIVPVTSTYEDGTTPSLPFFNRLTIHHSLLLVSSRTMTSSPIATVTSSRPCAKNS